MRLHDFILGRESWGTFWRLLDQLGGDSRYRKALLDDPEAVRRTLEAQGSTLLDDEAEKWRPASADWSLDRELIAEVRDLLADAVVILAHGLPGKDRRFVDPFPRPETEWDRYRAQQAQDAERRYDQNLQDIVAQAQQRWREQQADEQPDQLGQQRPGEPPAAELGDAAPGDAGG